MTLSLALCYRMATGDEDNGYDGTQILWRKVFDGLDRKKMFHKADNIRDSNRPLDIFTRTIPHGRKNVLHSQVMMMMMMMMMIHIGSAHRRAFPHTRVHNFEKATSAMINAKLFDLTTT